MNGIYISNLLLWCLLNILLEFTYSVTVSWRSRFVTLSDKICNRAKITNITSFIVQKRAARNKAALSYFDKRIIVIKFYSLARDNRVRAHQSTRNHAALFFAPRFIPLRAWKRKRKIHTKKEGERERKTRQKIVQQKERVERKGYERRVARVRSLKPSRGNAKHVTVLKESERSKLRTYIKAVRTL